MDWPEVAHQFVATLPATIAAIGALIVAWRSGHKVDLQAEDIKRIEHATNGMKDALVEATRAKGEAVGYAQGMKDQRRETAEEHVAALLKDQS